MNLTNENSVFINSWTFILAFEDCVKDAVCAGETVRGYMSKFAQDCNKDGIINCDDFARYLMCTRFWKYLF